MNKPTVPAVHAKDRKHQDAEFLELDESTMDATKHYRWCYSGKNDSTIAKRRMQGYEIETTDGEVRTKSTPDSRGDNAIAIGDVVLMSCPKELWDERQLASYQKREAILHSTTAETQRRAKEKGITLIQDEDHGKETR